MSTALRLESLIKRFGDRDVVQDVSLTIDAGELLVLVGPSGCGKSTILRMIAGLESPTAGRVFIGDKEVTTLAPGRRNVGMVFQQPAAFPYLTIADNLGYGMKARRVPRAERQRRVRDTATLLGIAELLPRRPAQLSGGERQRVELGRALLRDPDVLLLDEPLSSLDAVLRTDLRAELARIHAEVGTTTILVTHDQIEATVLGSRIGVMNEGRIVQLGTPAEIYESPADTFVASFVGVPPITLLPAVVHGGRVWLGDVAVASANGSPAGSVTVGVRPADIELAEESSLRANVIAAEDHGADRVVILQLPHGPTFMCRVPRSVPVTLGGSTGFVVRHHHLFDATTGGRLR